MTAIVQVAEPTAKKADIEAVFKYWRAVDRRFSPFKTNSELSKFSRQEIAEKNLSSEMKEILMCSEQTRLDTDGYFNIRRPDSQLDPSGLVKGWAIWQGAKMLKELGYRNFYVEIAGDIQTSGHNDHLKSWRVGIRHPFEDGQIVKVLELSGEGIATSGNYLQDDHIYDPVTQKTHSNIVSLTVIGPNIYEADRMATAAFAMGQKGLDFIEAQPDLEGYLITADGQTRSTSGFDRLVVQAARIPG